MNMFDQLQLQDLYRLVSVNGITFSYKGPITQDILEVVGDSLRDKLSSQAIENKLIRRVFSVFIEDAQNVLKHSCERSETLSEVKPGVGIVGVGRNEDNDFYVFSGNFILRKNEAQLKKQIDYINSLEPRQLQEYYNKTRKSGTLTEEGSAGLGFIDMARKSGNPLQYRLTPCNDDKSFFEVVITISDRSQEEK